MQVIEFTKKQKITKAKPEVEELIKKMRKEDEKLVKGQFEFTEAGAGEFQFAYRIYPGLIQFYTIKHGEICELPLGVVKHLNNTYKKIRNYDNVELTESGRFKKSLPYTTESRVRFVPTEFI